VWAASYPLGASSGESDRNTCWTKGTATLAAINEEALTDDPPRSFGGEGHDNIGHVDRPPHAPKWDILHDWLFCLHSDTQSGVPTDRPPSLHPRRELADRSLIARWYCIVPFAAANTVALPLYLACRTSSEIMSSAPGKFAAILALRLALASPVLVLWTTGSRADTSSNSERLFQKILAVTAAALVLTWFALSHCLTC
jgi:hypothetical protein